jgi:hypothetical protein
MPDQIIRFTCFIAGALLVYFLFYFGAKPIAVGLFAPPADKIVHAGVYGLIALLLWLAFERRYPLMVIGLVALIGAADEFYQSLLPGRSAHIGDWAVDVGGACLPLLVMLADREKNRNGGVKESSLPEGVERTI